ncbi:hypothetical protein D3C80_2197430 [compost metagenome]
MEPGKLAKFQYESQRGAAHEDLPETGERRGLGVCNVADRIRIGYGLRYGLFISSSPGAGTVIKLVLPLTEGGDGG